MNIKINFILLLTLFNISFDSLANTRYIRTSSGIGNFWPHSFKIEPLKGDQLTHFDIDLGFNTDGQKQWHHDYNFPNYGISYGYIDLGNDYFLGKWHSLSFFLESSSRKDKRIRLYPKFHVGLAYITQTFREDLPKEYEKNNFAISSHVNFTISFHLVTDIKISPSLDVFVTGKFSHASNGSIKSPNIGLNLFNAGLGLKYKFTDKSEYPKREISEVSKRYYFTLTGATGYHKFRNPYDVKFWIGSLSTNISYRLNHKSRVGAGIDLFYDDAINSRLGYARGKSSVTYKHSNGFRSGLYVGHDLMIGKFEIMAHLGFYIRNTFPQDGTNYFRTGFRYFVQKKMYTHLAIKSHKFNADMLEWGLGIQW